MALSLDWVAACGSTLTNSEPFAAEAGLDKLEYSADSEQIVRIAEISLLERWERSGTSEVDGGFVHRKRNSLCTGVPSES